MMSWDFKSLMIQIRKSNCQIFAGLLQLEKIHTNTSHQSTVVCVKWSLLTQILNLFRDILLTYLQY